MLDVSQLHVPGRHQDLVPPSSFNASVGSVLLLQADEQESRTTLALNLTDRMKPKSGSVGFNGVTGKNLRRVSALVDAPEVNEPERHLKVQDVVAEDLALQPRGYRGTRNAKRWLSEHDFPNMESEWIDTVPATLRLELLTALALSDPAVELLVVDSPDRHTPEFSDWLPLLSRLAADPDRPLCVLATVAGVPDEYDGGYFVMAAPEPYARRAATDPVPAVDDPEQADSAEQSPETDTTQTPLEDPPPTVSEEPTPSDGVIRSPALQASKPVPHLGKHSQPLDSENLGDQS